MFKSQKFGKRNYKIFSDVLSLIFSLIELRSFASFLQYPQIKHNLNITTSNIQRLDTFYVFDQIGLIYSVTSSTVQIFVKV